jgi:hypothetical protein
MVNVILDLYIVIVIVVIIFTDLSRCTSSSWTPCNTHVHRSLLDRLISSQELQLQHILGLFVKFTISINRLSTVVVNYFKTIVIRITKN